MINLARIVKADKIHLNLEIKRELEEETIKLERGYRPRNTRKEINIEKDK